MTTTRCPYCAEEIQAEAIKCKHCGTWLSVPPDGGPSAPCPLVGPTSERRLTRSSTHRMLAGVCGGLGQYVGIDPTIVRLAVMAISLFTAVVPGLILYAILTLVVPRDDALPY